MFEFIMNTMILFFSNRLRIQVNLVQFDCLVGMGIVEGTGPGWYYPNK